MIKTECSNCIYNSPKEPCLNRKGVEEGGCNRGIKSSDRLMASLVRDKLVPSIKKTLQDYDRKPFLAIVVADGYNPSSTKYINNKCKLAKEIGIEAVVYCVDWEDKNKEELETELFNLISDLNRDNNVDGIIVQLPFPLVDEQKIATTIDPNKDVDGFHPVNQGLLMRGSDEGFIPCTPLGAMTLLDHYDIDVEGKHCVVVGRSDIVGKPMAQLLINKGATVTVCNSKTKSLWKHLFSADVVFLGTGNARKFNSSDLSYSTIVIDFGINFDQDGKLCGDLDIEDVDGRIKAFTPTPGGTGVTTVMALMLNTVKAFEKKFK